MKKWLRVSLLLWMFYEVMWMLFDSTADRPVILPSAIEYLTDFAVCATQTFFCFLLIRFEIHHRILFASRRMTLSLLLSILFLLNMAVAVPITWVEIGVYGLMDSEKWSLRDHLLNDMVLSMVSTLLLALQLVIRYVRELKIATARRERQQQVEAETRMLALQSQTDPHFLFNSLNIAIGLVGTEPEKAEAFLADLAGIYRHILQRPDRYCVTIREELENLDRYMALIAIRFGPSVRLQTDAEVMEGETLIVRGVLQLLVENAVKHNRRSDAQPLHIRIRREDDFYVVENDYRPMADGHLPSAGIGQQNVRERYRVLGADRVETRTDGGKYSVRIPILCPTHAYEDTDH